MSRPRPALAPALELPAWSRRNVLQWSVGATLGAPWSQGLLGQETPATTLAPLNRFPRMVQEFFVEQVRAAEQLGLKRKAALRSQADAEAYVREVRELIQKSFGPFPEKTPLKPRITGALERDGYRVEKVIFESRPDFPVTANLYVPKGRKFPLPGVVGSCGHSLNGKAEKAYQSFCQGLVRQGYVVLIFDPIGQGERLQYEHSHDGEVPVRPGVGEHIHAGNQQFLVDEFFGSWRAWDGIRALDYLLTREEVDPRHIGITGNSGGGTMTTWLAGVDQRWTMAAPSCFVTTFRRNMENELPADTEQCPPRCLAYGLDHDDFLAALAPKPVIVLAQEQDFFDARGSEEAYGRLKRLYALLGKPDNVQLFVGPRPHGYAIENREAMYGFFNRSTGIAEGGTEPELTLEKDEDLQCTPTGKVADLKPQRTLFSFTQEKARDLAAKRVSLESGDLKAAIQDVLKLPAQHDPLDYRILRTIGGRRYPRKFFTTYAVETEPGVHAIVYRLTDETHISRPTRGVDHCVLYLGHQSSDADLRNEPLIKELMTAEPGVPFYTCDVRGLGESTPDTCGANSFLSQYGSDYFYSAHGIMLDRPYLGQRTHDVQSVLRWLVQQGHTRIHLAARGWSAIPATFAAVLVDSVTQVTLKNSLKSYQQLAETEFYRWPLATLAPGVLAKFDLPDCYLALQAKQLRQVDPWGPLMEPDGNA